MSASCSLANSLSSKSHGISIASILDKDYLTHAKKNDKTPINWTPEAEAAFIQCKNGLAKATLLTHPAVNAKLRLITDASDTAMGAAIEQKVGNEPWKPLAFFSRKLSGTQKKYSTYDRELTAMHESLVHFKDFLEGCDFEIHTDLGIFTTFTQSNQKPKQTTSRQRFT